MNRFLPPILLCVAILIGYANTLKLGYALDDRLVIFHNDYTLQGFEGVKDVMTSDGFSGYFGEVENLVAGGRYRPLTQLTFIVEYELFGKNIHDQVGMGKSVQNEQLFLSTNLPFISHLGNIIFYILLCLLIYIVLGKLFPADKNTKWYFSLPFIATLLFILHPIHTEVVANIKGRDEILSMLGGIATLYCILLYVEKRNGIYLALSFFTMIFGVFAKENAITFIAIIPLVIYFFNTKKKKTDWIVTLIPSILAVISFVTVRYIALGGFMPEDESHILLNNPFMESSTTQRIATVIFTWGIYLKLLFFPHPLTHDYYPRQIEITSFANPWVILLVIFLLFIIFYALKNLKSKNTISFGILFFIITFSIVSNLFINIGTFMNERFLFAPLLGFTVIIAYYLGKLFQARRIKMLSPIILSILILGYSAKTISRNLVWENDYTLFSTDVLVSKNSIKCNVSAGGSYLEKYKKEKRESDLKKAEKYLYKAFTLDNKSYYANLLLGEAYFFLEKHDLSHQHYKNAASLNPQDQTASENVKISLLKMEASQLDEANKLLEAGQAKEAMNLIDNYLAINPPSAYTYNLKGRIFGMGMNQLDSSIVYFNKAIEMDPQHSSALENLGVAYAFKREYETSIRHLLQAHEFAPENIDIIQNIIRVYTNMGKKEVAATWEERLARDYSSAQ